MSVESNPDTDLSLGIIPVTASRRYYCPACDFVPFFKALPKKPTPRQELLKLISKPKEKVKFFSTSEINIVEKKKRMSQILVEKNKRILKIDEKNKTKTVKIYFNEKNDKHSKRSSRLMEKIHKINLPQLQSIRRMKVEKSMVKHSLLVEWIKQQNCFSCKKNLLEEFGVFLDEKISFIVQESTSSAATILIIPDYILKTVTIKNSDKMLSDEQKFEELKKLTLNLEKYLSEKSPLICQLYFLLGISNFKKEQYFMAEQYLAICYMICKEIFSNFSPEFIIISKYLYVTYDKINQKSLSNAHLFHYLCCSGLFEMEVDNFISATELLTKALQLEGSIKQRKFSFQFSWNEVRYYLGLCHMKLNDYKKTIFYFEQLKEVESIESISVPLEFSAKYPPFRPALVMKILSECLYRLDQFYQAKTLLRICLLEAVSYSGCDYFVFDTLQMYASLFIKLSEISESPRCDLADNLRFSFIALLVSKNLSSEKSEDYIDLFYRIIKIIASTSKFRTNDEIISCLNPIVHSFHESPNYFHDLFSPTMRYSFICLLYLPEIVPLAIAEPVFLFFF